MNYEQLSVEQREFIDEAIKGSNILVDACIGSGKTTAIQSLCQYLPDKRILYLTYNKLLKIDAKEKIKQKNVQVTNYNGFVFWCLSQSHIRCGISDQFQQFNSRNPKIPKKYDVLILDEYQDIEEEMTTLLMRLKNENRNLQIIAVGDMDQKIYDKTSLNVKEFVNELLGDYTPMTFTQCFRLSKDIAAKYGKIWNKSIVGVNDDCKVKYIFHEDRAVLAKLAVKYLADKEPGDILCLGARTGILADVLNDLEDNYYHKFNKSTVYASIKEGDRGVEPNKDVAIFTTFDSSKGMERPICMVFDYDIPYWEMRTSYPDTNINILRNIFCVAGSRGKKEIIFVATKGTLLPDEMIMDNTAQRDDYNEFEPSNMYDFIYKEDVEYCYDLLEVERIDVKKDKMNPKIADKDEMIDLSPCLGHYQETSFFKKYDIDDEIMYRQKRMDTAHQNKYGTHRKGQYLYRTENPDIMEKILFLTTMETKQDRYIKQAKLNFVSKSVHNLMHKRLKNLFDGNELVQVDCGIRLTAYGQRGEEHELTFIGRADVLKDDVVYELKFKKEVTHNDFLQLAFYLVAMNKPYGYLYNVRNNELYKVNKPDDEEFMRRTVRAVTKQALYMKEDDNDDMDDYEKYDGILLYPNDAVDVMLGQMTIGDIGKQMMATVIGDDLDDVFA